jgi:hypothetical protein
MRMRTSILCGLVVVSSSVLWAADPIHPLDVKLGLWESTWTNQMSGQMPIPPEAMANLTPEQRAKFEEAMKARASQAPREKTRRQCMTREKMDKDPFGDDRKGCTRTVTTSTSHKLEMRVECSEQGMKSTGTFRVEATDSESVKGTTQMVMSGGDRTMNMNASFTAKWIGPDCGTVK